MNTTISKKIIIRALSALIAAVFLSAAVFVSGCSVDSREWVLKTVRENYYFYDEMDKEGLDDLSIEEIVKRLDIYSAYYTAEEYEALLKDYSGEKAGIGFSYIYLESGVSSLYPDGGCLLALVVGNSPADKAGLKTGMVLTGGTFNGKTAVFDREGALEEFLSPIAVDVMFTLTDGEGADHEVCKTEYFASYMTMSTSSSAFVPAFDTKGNVKGIEEVDGAIEYLPDGFAYMSMSQFFGTAATEFGYLMQEFNAEGCTSLILDLRSNGGGYVDVMCDMAGYFTSSLNLGVCEAMIAEYKNGRKVTSLSKPHSGNSLVPADTTVYVLANSGTASASEALIGVLVSYGFLDYENIFLSEYGEEFLSWAGEDYKSGQSYGKGIMQSPFQNIWTHEVLKLTTAQIFWPNGKTIHRVGLTPEDGCRLVGADWIVTPDDSELQRVVEMIKG